MKSNGFSRMILLLVLVCLTLMAFSTMFAQAKQGLVDVAQVNLATEASAGTVIAVSTTADELNDDGDCSLREAVEAANTDTAVDNCPAGNGWDTITVPAGSYEITLAGSGEDGNATGDLDLLDSVTINGAGVQALANNLASEDSINGLAPTGTLLNGTGLDRVFHLDPTNLGVSLELNDMTITNGSAGDGGGLLISNGNALLQNMIFANNSATGSGGAISLDYGTLTLMDSTLNGNTAVDYAGGLYVGTAVATIKNSDLTYNTADYGGGLYIDNGSITFSDSKLNNNTANTNGGGLYAYVGNLIVENGSEIGYNESDGEGGGLYTDDNVTLLIEDSWVHHNDAVGDGGGLYMYGYGGLVQNSTFENNTTEDEGGGIYAYGDLIVRNSTLSHNDATAYGGAIFQYEDSVVLANNNIYSNTAEYGGGVYLEEYAGLVMRDTVVRENWALEDGGGLFVYYESGAIIEDSAFIGNVSDEGGAIMAYEYVALNIERSLFSNNQATSDGGAIYLYDYAAADIRNSTFSGNHADSDGGALYVYYPSAVIENGTIVNNTADGSGGGIYSDYYGHIQNSIVAGNSAGGSTMASDADCQFDGELFSGGSNVFGDGTGCDATRYDQTIDPADVFSTLVGPLANNAGRPLPDGTYLQTHALLSGSPAVDAAHDMACPAEDQRGIVRNQGNACDIGAYESEYSATVPTPASNTITVNTTEDANVVNSNCSLQEAVEAANTDTAVDACAAGNGWDTIILPAGTYVLTDSGIFTTTQSLTIQGATAATTIIDGNDMDVEMIDNETTLVLRDVTLTNGSFTSSGEGCIYNDEGFLILEDSAITNCEMQYGGAISNVYGVVRLLSSTLSGNDADYGGGIYNYYGAVSVADSTLKTNSADTYGGAIYGESSALRLENSQVLSNTSAIDGGGIEAEYGSLLIDNTQFSYNEAANDAALDGYYNSTAIDNSIFTYNTATSDDGAVDITEGGWVRDSEFAFNTSNDEAGALDGASLIQNSTFHHNQATNYGGSLNFWGVLENSVVSDSAAQYGGGIYAEGVILINATIDSNQSTAYGGGGLYVEEYGGVISLDSTFSDNVGYVGQEGSAIYATGMPVTAHGTTFSGNHGASSGGAIYSYDAAVDLLNSTVSGNSAVQGGGLYVESGTLSLNFTTVANNDGITPLVGKGDIFGVNGLSTASGGGIYVYDAAATIQNSILAGNSVDSNSSHANADCEATAPLTFAGYSIFGDGTGCNSPVSSDYAVDPATIFTAVLKPLANYGGNTQTHALSASSPALNAANPDMCPVFDQRGVGRPSSSCDSGAYEFLYLYLPIIFNNYESLPDLIVQSLTVTNNGVTVVIANQGDATVSEDFWVDVYINPGSVPTKVNQTWQTIGGEGLIWGVTSQSLSPGDTLTLTINDGYFVGSESNFSDHIPANAQVYAQVDSANTLTNYGAILESHEAFNGNYNNIIGPVSP